jgi:hypothetical protein
MFGVFRFFALLGSAIILLFGGYMFDLGNFVPFLTIAGFSISFFLYLLAMIFMKKLQKKIIMDKSEILRLSEFNFSP